MLEKLRLRNVSNKPDCLVDHCFRHASNGVSLREIRELVNFDDVCNHVFVLNGDFVGQPGNRRTIRSGRCHENLNVKIFIERLKRFDRRFREIALSF